MANVDGQLAAAATEKVEELIERIAPLPDVQNIREILVGIRTRIAEGHWEELRTYAATLLVTERAIKARLKKAVEGN